MIEQAADSVLRETSAIEKVLHQIGTHQEVDGVDLVAVGNALAPLILWREAVQELKRVSAGINIADIEATEKFLDRIEKQDSSVGKFAPLHRIMEQQKHLVGLQRIKTRAIQKSLEGTQVDFSIPESLTVGKWLRERGYVLFVPTDIYRRYSDANRRYSDATPSDASGASWVYPDQLHPSNNILGVFTLQQQEHKVAFIKRGTTVSVKSICILYLQSSASVWKMGICGWVNIPEALMLAKGLSRYMQNKKIITAVASEEPYENSCRFYSKIKLDEAVRGFCHASAYHCI